MRDRGWVNVLGLVAILTLTACGGGHGDRPSSYSIGGTVSGLAGTGLVLHDNGADSVAVSGNGSFMFPTPVSGGQAYSVTVATQPSNPIQTCSVRNGMGQSSAAAQTSVAVVCITPQLALFAGSLGGLGWSDGTGSAARFAYPGGVATDSAGNIYVADTGNGTVRKITPDGAVSTFAGTAGTSGSADGTGSAARFGELSAIATDSAGNVYVTDAGNNTVRKITPNGVVSTLAGTAGTVGSVDGTGAAARFNNPNGITTDRAGNVYVADTGNNTVRKITPDGVVSTFAGTAQAFGNTDGTGAAARFTGPVGMATDGAGNIYVAEIVNYDVRKITPDGVVSTFAGRYPGYDDPCAGVESSPTTFCQPWGVATDGAGNVYVADTGHDTVSKITPDGVVSTFAGTTVTVGSVDGTGAAARFNDPSGITTDGAGNVYVADTVNDTIRKITPDGVVSTLAGTAQIVGSADGTGAAARFSIPQGVATDSAGNVFVADSTNNAVRKITPDAVVTTLARGLALPEGVAIDSAGNVFVADTGSNTVRQITPGGVVSTFAGQNTANSPPCQSVDGVGTAATFCTPTALATDSAANIYVADAASYTVRKITPNGVVSTLAGMAGTSGSVDGTGAAARFFQPGGIAVDSAGNLYVADTLNDAVRKITPDGTVTTIVGTPGQRSFVPGDLPGVLNQPMAVAISGTSLYITLESGVAVAENLLATP